MAFAVASDKVMPLTVPADVSVIQTDPLALASRLLRETLKRPEVALVPILEPVPVATSTTVVPDIGPIEVIESFEIRAAFPADAVTLPAREKPPEDVRSTLVPATSVPHSLTTLLPGDIPLQFSEYTPSALLS